MAIIMWRVVARLGKTVPTIDAIESVRCLWHKNRGTTDRGPRLNGGGRQTGR